MLSRRNFLLGSAAAGTLASLPTLTHAQASDRPNIIVILSDDMGFSDIGCYGSEIETPVLDGLAKNGLRFTQFYNTARCCPTRASLLTGLYPHQAGMGHMTSNRNLRGYGGEINNKCVTIAEALKPANYSCYMSGKWHLTPHTRADGPKDNWPRQRGFDRFYGTIMGGGSFWDPGALTRDNTAISAFADPEYKPDGPYYYTNAISDNACRYIDEHDAQKPFFMYVAYTAAHWPMHALPEDIAHYKGKYDGGFEPIRKARFERMKKMGLIDKNAELSPAASKWGDDEKFNAWEARNMEVYAAMITSMDRGIGKIVDTLKQQKLFENTLILFMQDNGACAENQGRSGKEKRADKPTLPPMEAEELQSNLVPKQSRDGYPVLRGTNILAGPADTYTAYGKGWANVSNTPFREYKHWVHEGGISSPLIAHWPQKIKRKGELEKTPTHLIDVMPTCLALANHAYPKKHKGQDVVPVEGRSLIPTFEGKGLERDAIFFEHEGNRALRSGDWKLVAKGSSGEWELYNISKDRSELHNLASQEPERLKAMVAKWDGWAERAHVKPWPWKTKSNIGSKKNKFVLSQGDNLQQEKAPRIANKTIRITAKIIHDGSDGVILAQGGTQIGFSLYIKNGKPTFTSRMEGKLTTIQLEEAAKKGLLEVKVELMKNGKMSLSLGDQSATGSTKNPITKMPVDGLNVGFDEKGAVGNYKAPFKYSGKINEVRLNLSKK